ncbi:hypothetical protein EG242_06530 [Paenimyroides viscosum]|uniref:Uncharacterized protein n=1 Tax=Paenimyroides viscosum TaxID=2488729 RepID=A0A3P1B3T8_9FLAO|nr:hypothetical protein [Paenimyroides viscosum]RRA95273.1 hypothetical protein EG242_06530 [Paenimyroides viscosum]
MKKITIIALFAALGMVSCNDKKAEATTTTTDTTATTDAAPVDPHAGHNHAPGEGHDHDHGATTEATEVAVGMNPAHGQPGHRCDIPVGAPLNSPPGQGAGQTAAPAAQPSQGGFLGGGDAQAQAPAQQQAAAPKQETAPGMKGKPNPAHGQPGHRCDISVGQPLP